MIWRIFGPGICSAAALLATGCTHLPQATAQVAGMDAYALSSGGLAASASVPDVAVDPANPQRVAVIWRYLNSGEPGSNAGERGMTCFLSLSSDGGRTFRGQQLNWNRPKTPVCNAPYVDIGPSGELLIGATLAGLLPQDAPEGTHAEGRVVMRLSTDWGQSWSPIRTAIATGDEQRFAVNPTVPAEATHVPWDGARGVFDRATGALFLSGGFPAPPGEDLHSQRFYTRSTDLGASWGPIYAFGGEHWPQRWDGRMVAAHGRLAVSYLAEDVPGDDARCLCVVFATSDDGGVTLDRHFVIEAEGFDRLVHYPPIAAHPALQDSYALAVVLPDAPTPVVRVTDDAGRSWRILDMPTAPADVVRASRPELAYTPGGALAVAWRGYHADGSYDTYATLLLRSRPAKILAVSTFPSTVPPELVRDYSVTGDFINTLAASDEAVHLAWTGWRSGELGQVFYRRLPLSAFDVE